MAHKAMPYRGDEYGFPKTIPEGLPSQGFVGWLLQEGYPQELLVAPPGFPEDVPFFCVCYDENETADPSHPDNPNFIDPYDPQVGFLSEPEPEILAGSELIT